MITQTSVVRSDGVSCTYAFDGEIKDGQTLTVFISARSTTSRLINYLLPEAAERFIDVGLDPLVEALGDLVPDPVGFVFYDQPAAGFYKWDQISGNLGNSLLFASTLPDAVLHSTGQPFAKTLLALLRDVGPETLRAARAILCRLFSPDERCLLGHAASMGRGQGHRADRTRDPTAYQRVVFERRFHQHRPQGCARRGFLRHRRFQA